MAINKINRLRFYAQKILPLSYDNSLTYLEWLEKVVATCNEVVTTINSIIDVVEDVESDVAEIRTQVTGILASISGIQTHLTSIDSSIGSLNSRMSNTETAIVSIQGDVSSLRADLNSLVVRVNSLSATVTGHTSAIGALERNVNDMSDNISDIQDDITAIQSSITTLNGRLNSALNDIAEHTSQISELENSVENLDRDVSGLTDVVLKNANYANDVIDFGFKNLLDVDTFNGGNVGNTQTSNGVTVIYLGGGVYKAYGTATAQTIIALGTMSYSEKLSGAKFNGLPNDADSRVFMSVREPWVSAYDTYLGTAHDYNTIGEFPTDTFSTVNVALQVGSYVNLGDGTDTFLTIKPMVINNDFPTGSPYFRDPSYIQFEPFVPTMLNVRESIKSVEDDIDGLQSDVTELQTDVTELQNEPKLPSYTYSDFGYVLGLVGSYSPTGYGFVMPWGYKQRDNSKPNSFPLTNTNPTRILVMIRPSYMQYTGSFSINVKTSSSVGGTGTTRGTISVSNQLGNHCLEMLRISATEYLVFVDGIPSGWLATVGSIAELQFEYTSSSLAEQAIKSTIDMQIFVS